MTYGFWSAATARSQVYASGFRRPWRATQDSSCHVVGNECEPYTAIAGLTDIEVFLCQSFSLMAQDRSRKPNPAAVLAEIGVKPGDAIGLAGWKYLESAEWNEAEPSFFVPALVVDSLCCVIGGGGTLRDVTPVLMHLETGTRRDRRRPDCRLEWASARGSDALWRIVSGAEAGENEFSAAARMGYAGDPFSCHVMLASGAPGEAILSLRSPTARVMQHGDRLDGGPQFPRRSVERGRRGISYPGEGLFQRLDRLV